MVPLEEVREQIVAKLIEEAQAKRIKGWIEQVEFPQKNGLEVRRVIVLSV